MTKMYDELAALISCDRLYASETFSLIIVTRVLSPAAELNCSIPDHHGFVNPCQDCVTTKGVVFLRCLPALAVRYFRSS